MGTINTTLDTKNNIELGSYGLRTISFEGKEYTWVYGTGMAEPRLTNSIILAKGE